MIDLDMPGYDSEGLSKARMSWKFSVETMNTTNDSIFLVFEYIHHHSSILL
jgi:hypothetical protein